MQSTKEEEFLRRIRKLEDQITILEREKAFFEKLVEFIPVPIFYEDQNRRYLGCNRAFAEYMGKPPERILRHTVEDVIPAENTEEYVQRDRLLIAQGGTSSEERELPHCDGTKHWVLLNKTVFRDSLGKVGGLIGAFVDIHERKKAQARETLYRKHLRALASGLSASKEQERKRIADIIHDSIGQNLALSKLRLQMLGENFSGENRLEINRIISTLDATICSARALTFDFGAPMLYHLGFDAAAAWIVERFRNNWGLRVCYTNHGISEILPENLKIFLFRSLQELLTNVSKHAETDKASVDLQYGPEKTLVLEVCDSGRGFDPLSTKNEGLLKSYGLFSLQEIVKCLGGYIEILSSPGEGTTVRLSIPRESFEEQDSTSQGPLPHSI